MRFLKLATLFLAFSIASIAYGQAQQPSNANAAKCRELGKEMKALNCSPAPKKPRVKKTVERRAFVRRTEPQTVPLLPPPEKMEPLVPLSVIQAMKQPPVTVNVAPAQPPILQTPPGYVPPQLDLGPLAEQMKRANDLTEQMLKLKADENLQRKRMADSAHSQVKLGIVNTMLHGADAAARWYDAVGENSGGSGSGNANTPQQVITITNSLTGGNATGGNATGGNSNATGGSVSGSGNSTNTNNNQNQNQNQNDNANSNTNQNSNLNENKLQVPDPRQPTCSGDNGHDGTPCHR